MPIQYMNKTKNKLRRILIEVLELDVNKLPEIIDVENSVNWDSLGHFQLIEKIEDEFNIEIEANKVVKLLGEREILNYLNENL
tara:strand:- start:55 stop:303 length:249 start_codon:yes stop_codon:yes gene_type:complete